MKGGPLPEGDDDEAGDGGAHQARVIGRHHGRALAGDPPRHQEVDGERGAGAEGQDDAGVEFLKAGPDDDEGADEAGGDRAPAPDADRLAQHQGRECSYHQGLDEEDRQRVGDRLVVKGPEEKAGSRHQEEGAAEIIKDDNHKVVVVDKYRLIYKLSAEFL